MSAQFEHHKYIYTFFCKGPIMATLFCKWQNTCQSIQQFVNVLLIPYYTLNIVRFYITFCMYEVHTAICLVSQVYNKELKVHGQIAEYFGRCFAIYKTVWPLFIQCIKKLENRLKAFENVWKSSILFGKWLMADYIFSKIKCRL